jgi:hypothetical protein
VDYVTSIRREPIGSVRFEGVDHTNQLHQVLGKINIELSLKECDTQGSFPQELNGVCCDPARVKERISYWDGM